MGTTVSQSASSRVLTVPNLISFARLLGVPLFAFLVLTHRDVAGLVVLVIGGSSDWIDGQVARAMGQVSRLGELLDPLADRLYILATVLVFTIRDIVPWQLTGALLARDLLLAATLPLLWRFGYGPPPVHFLGKTATFVLLAAFPFLLFATLEGVPEAIGRPIGWAAAIWGLALYWAAGLHYLKQVWDLVSRARAEPEPGA